MVKPKNQGFCNKCHKTVSHLPNHRRQVHDTKLTTCGYCNKTVNRTYLRKHTENWHPGFEPKPRPPGQVCPHCSRDFCYSSNEYFMNHVTNCPQNPASDFQQRAFHCNFCTKTFVTRHNLMLHTERRHEAEPPAQGEPAAELEISSFREETFDPEQLFVKTKEHQKQSNRFKATEKTVKFRITELGLRLCRAGMILPVVSKILYSVIDIGQYDPESLISVTIDSPGLDHGHTSGLQQVKHFQTDLFLIEFEKIIDSSDIIRLQNDELTIEVRNIELRTAVRGKLNVKHFADVTDFLKRKRGLADPDKIRSGPNFVGSCFIISIAMSLYAEGKNLKQMWFYRDGHFPTILENLVCSIYENIDLDLDSPISVQHYQTINSYLQRQYGRNLVVYNIPNESTEIHLVYKGSPIQTNPLAVLTTQTHCWLITDMDLLFSSIGYCPICFIPLKTKGKFKHECAKKCIKCQSKACVSSTRQKPSIATVLCEECSCFFMDDYCYLQHTLKDSQGLSACDKFKRCTTCGKKVKAENLYPLEQHHCLKSKCFNCNEWEDMNHQCYLRAPALQNCIKKKTRLLYFDLETRETEQGQLVPFLFCLIQTCDECADDIHGHLYSYRKCCGANRIMFWMGDDCMKSACKYIFFNQQLSGSLLIAHNFSGFDGFFIYETLIDMGKNPTILIRGNRILSLRCGLNIRCICSLNFFHCKLSKLSKMFDLHDEKQFLPLKLLKNLDPNKNIKGWVPPKEVWQPELMSPERRVKFQEYYAYLQTHPEKFDFFYILRFYCAMDTKILYQSCQLFRQMLIEETGICPFTSGCLTLTALTTKVWKKKFLDFDPQSRLTNVALIPDVDVKANLLDNQSLIARCYISWIQYKNPEIRIDYAGNGKEHRIGKKRVDAMIYDPEGQPSRILEVHGCFWHAHSNNCDLFPGKWELDFHPIFKPLRWVDVNARTVFRQKELENETHLAVTAIYECEILRELKKSNEMKVHFDKYKMAERFRRPLNPREALYGGRVSQGILLAELSDSQINEDKWEISHLDLNSLYPFVMANNVFPQGHPTKLDGWTIENVCSFEVLQQYFGLIVCRVLAPSDVVIQYPPLPIRIKDRLVFPLCRTCADQQDHNVYCNHSDEQRSWVGTFCTPELLNAMSNHGYIVTEVYQIWHFEQSSEGIFRSFVNHWAALKLKSSGFPADVKTRDEKEEYVQIINDNYGCSLQVEDIGWNEAMRNLAKLLSNSLWGRLGLSSNKNCTDVKVIHTVTELRQIMSLPGLNIKDARIVAANKLLVTYETGTEFNPVEDRQSNVVLAAFTLCYARMVLQDMLDRVDYNTCYTDTDSIIFLHKRGSPLVPQETFLYGGWKKETLENHIIRSFLCLGPKAYAYKTAEVDPISGNLVPGGKTKTVMKAKGLQVDCRKDIGFETMKKVLVNNLSTLTPSSDGPESNNDDQEDIEKSILIPDPTFQRNLLRDPKGVMKIDRDRMKRLNFSLTKRQYLYMPNDIVGVCHRTNPWGLRFS